MVEKLLHPKGYAVRESRRYGSDYVAPRASRLCGAIAQ